MDMWLRFQMASTHYCFRSIFNAQLCHFFICWFGCGRCFCFPWESFSKSKHQFCASLVLFYFCYFVLLWVLLLSLSLPIFWRKKIEDMMKIIFSLFWSWLFQILYIYLILVLTEYNDEISLWALLMLPVKRVPHILLLLPFITKYYMIPVSLSSLKPGITKDIFVQFMSCRFKSPSSCEFHVFSWLHLWSI